MSVPALEVRHVTGWWGTAVRVSVGGCVVEVHVGENPRAEVVTKLLAVTDIPDLIKALEKAQELLGGTP